MSRTPWFAYKIPPVVERENPSDVYALGWDHDLADSYDGDPTATNPTQFLKWKKVEASGSSHPFAVYLQTNSNGLTQVRVEASSIVYAGIGTYEGISISGLNTLVNPVEGYVTISADVENNAISSAGFTVNWGDDTSARAVWNGNNEQTYLEARIAYLYSINGQWSVRQIVFGNLTAMTGCYDGKPTIVLIQT
jgi:hypothetical protein